LELLLADRTLSITIIQEETMKRSLVLVVMLTSIATTFSFRCLAQTQSRLSITGSVVYPDGKPAPGVRVFRYKSDNPTGLQGGTLSQENGTFALDDLEPGVSYDLCASKPEAGYLDPYFLPFGLPVGGQCRSVVLRPGINPGTVRLQLSRKSGSLAGRLLDARTSQPVNGGTVTLYRPLKLEQGGWILVDSKQATWIPSVEQQTDATGKFSFSNLPEGVFFLRAEATGYRNWFPWNQSSESSAQTVRIKSGETRSLVAALQPSGH
jgi:hypothetical protein